MRGFAVADLAQTLAQLRDIHLPPPVDWWPPAPGWWLLLGAMVLALGSAWLVKVLHTRRRLQRRALELLNHMERHYLQSRDAIVFASQVSALLRRVAVIRFPEQHPAGLTGEAWLDFLDRTGGNGAFRHGPGASLASAPYQPRGDLDAYQLARVVRQWLEHAAAAPRRPAGS